MNQQSESFMKPKFVRAVDSSYEFSWFDWFCLWYPPGWLILFNRHWQHYHADPDGWNWLEYGLFLFPGGFYLALLLRWLRLGCRLPRNQGYQFNPQYQQAFRDDVLAAIVKYYFRAELHQAENLPQTGPLIVAMNHAGMCFPWDFLALGYLLGETREWVVQPLAHIALFNHPWVTWWLPPDWAQVLGGVKAELNDFEAAIAEKKIILYAPEGLRGPGKGWQKRYQLETFDLSFIRLSDRYNIPILPIVCLGNESLHPWSVNFKNLARRLKLPFLPVSMLMFVFIFFPSMGVWAMRSRLHYFVQSVNQIEVNKLGHTTAYKYAQELRGKLQSQINQLLSSN